MSQIRSAAERDRGRKRRLRKPTPERLRRRALAYLERFATTRAHLRDVLLRRALSEADAFELPAADLRADVEALVDDLQRLGLIDDRLYADARARRLLAKGKPIRYIRSSLEAKGVERTVLDATIEGLAEQVGDVDLQAAIAFARRRRLGPWRKTDLDRQRELAAFARAGFSYAVATRVISAETVEELSDRPI